MEKEAFIANFKGPIKRQEINFYSGKANFIGGDVKYQFGKTIRLINGEPLKVHPKDHYCDLEASHEPANTRFQELPSSLFSQARYGDQVVFIRNETLYVLTLKPYINTRGESISFDD